MQLVCFEDTQNKSLKNGYASLFSMNYRLKNHAFQGNNMVSILLHLTFKCRQTWHIHLKLPA